MEGEGEGREKEGGEEEEGGEGGRRREERRRRGGRRGRELKHTWGDRKRTQKGKDSLQSKEKNNCDEETDDGNAESNFGDNLQW